MTLGDTDDLRAQLGAYEAEHRALDAALAELHAPGRPVNLMAAQQMKKKKLWLKDTIQRIRSALIDDIIA